MEAVEKANALIEQSYLERFGDGSVRGRKLIEYMFSSYGEQEEEANGDDWTKLQNPQQLSSGLLRLFTIAKAWPLRGRDAVEIDSDELIVHMGFLEFAANKSTLPSLQSYHWDLIETHAGRHVGLLRLLSAISKKFLPEIQRVTIVFWCGCKYGHDVIGEQVGHSDAMTKYHLVGRATLDTEKYPPVGSLLDLDKAAEVKLFDQRRRKWPEKKQALFGSAISCQEVRKCLACGASGKRLRHCTVCSKIGLHVSYCDAKCQRQHWEKHKIFCKKSEKTSKEIHRNRRAGMKASALVPLSDIIAKDGTVTIPEFLTDDPAADWNLMTDFSVARWECGSLNFSSSFYQSNLAEFFFHDTEDTKNDNSSSLSSLPFAAVLIRDPPKKHFTIGPTMPRMPMVNYKQHMPTFMQHLKNGGTLENYRPLEDANLLHNLTQDIRQSLNDFPRMEEIMRKVRQEQNK